MIPPINFYALHSLLSCRTSDQWSYIFGQDHEIGTNFNEYCAGINAYFKERQPDRVVLLQTDRAAFLGALLIAFQNQIEVVLPHFKTPDALAELIQPGDLILDDNLVIPFLQTDGLSNTESKNQGVIWLYTSGSTGNPKPIKKTIQQLEAEIATLHGLWGCDFVPTVWSTVPQHHIYGLLFSLLWPVCAGYKIQSHAFNFWEEIIDQIKYGDFLISSPAHLSRTGAIDLEVDLQVFSSGALLSFDHAQQIQKIFTQVPKEIFGSTETGGIAYRQQQASNQPWTVFPGLNISVNDTQNLMLQSPYLPDNQFHETSDRITFLDKDQFVLLGRSDRVVKIEGKRVNLSDFERRLISHDFIKEVTAIPLLTQRDEIGIVAVLSSIGQKNMSDLGKEKFIRQLRLDLSSYFEQVLLPRRWRFVEEFPVDDRGKKTLCLLESLFEMKV